MSASHDSRNNQHHQHHGQHDTSIEVEELFPWPHFLTFCLVTSLWLVQQVLQASSTVQEMQISGKELDALRYDFSQYDAQLSGEIPISDLGALLQDMGTEYTDQEVEIILQDINSDHLGTIEFAEFIRWWCKDNCSNKDDDNYREDVAHTRDCVGQQDTYDGGNRW